jgi:hypothetical protein
VSDNRKHVRRAGTAKRRHPRVQHCADLPDPQSLLRVSDRMQRKRNSAKHKLTKAPASTANPTLRTSTSTNSCTRSPLKTPRTSGVTKHASFCHGRTTSTKQNLALWLAETTPGSTAADSMPHTTAWTVTRSRTPTSLPLSTRQTSKRVAAQSPMASSWHKCHSSRGY